MREMSGCAALCVLLALASLARAQDVNIEFYSQESHVRLPLYMVSPIEKARRLVAGMARDDVVKLMGKADWAITRKDGGPFALQDEDTYLELHWENPGCASVFVRFDRAGRVIDWDDGDLCFSTADALSPTSRYSCYRADREAYCE